MAADIGYECLGGDVYRFRLTLYRSCSGIPAGPFEQLSIVSQTCNYQEILMLDSLGPGTEVSSICAAQINNTDCSGGSYPGVQLYYYEITYTMPMHCTDWIITWESCCRNVAISTGASQEGMSVTALLNNQSVQTNNSPSFSTLAVPYFCAGSPVTYSHATIELDGDSLVYELVSPMQYEGLNYIPPSTVQAVTFLVPYSPTYPISTIPVNSFSFSSQTGVLNFTPATIQQGVMAVRVYEYRNGVLIGYVTRDIQIVVMNCNAGTIDISTPANVIGALQQPTDSSVFGICPNTPMSFSVVLSSSSSSLMVNSNNTTSIPNSTVTFSGTNPMTATFNWTPPANASGSFSFSLSAVDNSCPVHSSANKNFIIRVLGIDILNNLTPLCPNVTDTIQLSSYGGTSNGVYSWTGPGIVNPNLANVTAIVNTVPSTYTVTYVENGCIAQDSYTLMSLGTITAVPDSATLCGSTLQLNALVNFVIPPPTCDTTSLSCVGASQNYSLGTGTSSSYDPTSWLDFTPFAQGYGGSRNVFLYKAADLSAAGLSAGLIKSISFKVTDKQTTFPYKDFRIKMRCSQLDTLNAFGIFPNGLREVYYNAALNTTLGWNTLVFDAPYYWDGTSNLLIGTCFEYDFNSTNFVNDTVQGAFSSQYCSITSGWFWGTTSICSSYQGASSKFLPNIKFDFCTVNPVTSYSWSPAWQVSNATILNPTCTPTTDVQLVVSATQAGCTIRDTVNIYYDNPYLNPIAPFVCCKGDSAHLYTNGLNSTNIIKWYLNGNLVYTGDTLSILPTVDVTYKVVSISPCGADSQYIEVKIAPNIHFAPVIVPANCGANVGSITLNANSSTTGTYAYSWHITPAQMTPTISNLAPNIYYVTVSNTEGCIKDTAIIVPFDADFVASVSNIIPVSCFGQNNGSASVSVMPPANYSYVWNTTPPQNTQTATNLSANTYIVSVSSPLNPNCIDTISVVVPEQPAIVPQAIEISPVRCKGEANGVAKVSATGGSGQYTYSWVTTPPVITPILASLSSGNYSVVVFDAQNVNCSASTTVYVSEPLTKVNASIVSIQNVSCNGLKDGVALATAAGGTGTQYTFEWKDIHNLILGTQAQITGLNEGTYYLIAADENSCKDTISISIQQPTKLIAIIDSTINANCDLANGQIFASASGGNPPYQYAWNSTPPQISQILTQVGEGTYEVEVTDNSGCKAKTSDNITVFPAPTAHFESNPNPQDTLFNLAPIRFYSLSTQTNQYSWNFGDGTFSSMENPIHHFPDYGTYLVVLTVNAIQGDCPVSDSLVYTVFPAGDMYIPSAFTPNLDGNNDYFYISGNGLSAFSCIIYDRWGKVAKELSGIADKWDGILPNGKPAPEGVYMYRASAVNKNGNKIEKAGTITLVR